MPRPIKSGLNYFPFDVDMFSDIKIRKLIKYQGGKAITVYAYLLCIIYKSGYYMKWDNELPFIISEQTGFEEAYIREVIKSCLTLGLFSKALYDSANILTSKGIQVRYEDITRITKRNRKIGEYNIISEGVIDEPANCKSEPARQTTSKKVKSTPTETLDKEIESLKKDECWLDQLQVLHSINIERLRNYLDDFKAQCLADGKNRHESYQDAKQHFNSWLRIVINKRYNNDDKDRTNNRNQRRGNILNTDEKKTYGGTF